MTEPKIADEAVQMIDESSFEREHVEKVKYNEDIKKIMFKFDKTEMDHFEGRHIFEASTLDPFIKHGYVPVATADHDDSDDAVLWVRHHSELLLGVDGPLTTDADLPFEIGPF